MLVITILILLVTTSKALVSSSVALVTSSFLEGCFTLSFTCLRSFRESVGSYSPPASAQLELERRIPQTEDHRSHARSLDEDLS